MQELIELRHEQQIKGLLSASCENSKQRSECGRSGSRESGRRRGLKASKSQGPTSLRSVLPEGSASRSATEALTRRCISDRKAREKEKVRERGRRLLQIRMGKEVKAKERVMSEKRKQKGKRSKEKTTTRNRKKQKRQTRTDKDLQERTKKTESGMKISEKIVARR